jgi:hypothetical protein
MRRLLAAHRRERCCGLRRYSGMMPRRPPERAVPSDGIGPVANRRPARAGLDARPLTTPAPAHPASAPPLCRGSNILRQTGVRRCRRHTGPAFQPRPAHPSDLLVGAGHARVSPVHAARSIPSKMDSRNELPAIRSATGPEQRRPSNARERSCSVLIASSRWGTSVASTRSPSSTPTHCSSPYRTVTSRIRACELAGGPRRRPRMSRAGRPRRRSPRR